MLSPGQLKWNLQQKRSAVNILPFIPQSSLRKNVISSKTETKQPIVERTGMEVPKQCWECRKRRLVCDSTKPTCKKCRVRRVECPGYTSKPLKWTQPCTDKPRRRRDRIANGDATPTASSSVVVSQSQGRNAPATLFPHLTHADQARILHEAVTYCACHVSLSLSRTLLTVCIRQRRDMSGPFRNGGEWAEFSILHPCVRAPPLWTRYC